MQKMMRASLVALVAGLLPAAALAQSCNTADRSVLLILDASGSMNAKLPNGETRIAVAQRAIKGVAGFIPAQAQLSLRMYGAQSAASQKNCQDTHLAVPFGPASASGGAITTTVDGAKAQGYTPIAYSLGQAANDFPADAKERVIVLVSDGKETCQGDPVVAAKALAAKGITVHTVGFIVDTAARGQLQAIARATGGTYFDAPVGPELPDTLKSGAERLQEARRHAAAEAAARQAAHHVRDLADVARRAQRGDRREGRRVQQLAPGDRSSRGHLRGEVRTGELEGHRGPPRRDHHDRSGSAEGRGQQSQRACQRGRRRFRNRREAWRFHPMSTSVTLMPGVYDLRFAKTEWRFIKVDGGKTVTLRPAAVILAEGLKWKKARVTTQDGKEVADFNAVELAGGAAAGRLHRRGGRQQNSLPLPPKAKCSR